MAGLKQIKVDITPAGSVKAEALGFSGTECEKATEHIEVVLGGVSVSKKKPEYFAPSTTGGVNTNGRVF